MQLAEITLLHSSLATARLCLPPLKNVLHVHSEYYSAIKNNDILSSATTSMKLDVIMLSEISQAQKDKLHMLSLNLWELKIKAPEPMEI